MAMDVALKTKWTEALDSEKYAQVRGVLHRTEPQQRIGDEPGYCCLGVLCEVAGLEQNAFGHFKMVDGWAGSEPSPAQLAEWGITIDEANDLIQMNDNDRLPFPEISEWIKENL